MRNTTTTVMIAAGAVLAAVIVTRTPAQQEYGGNGACCLPTGGCYEAPGEATCIAEGGTYLGDNTNCAGSQCPSVAPPTVVSVSSSDVYGSFSNSQRIVRAWSDGHVDTTYVRFFASTSCDITEVCGPVTLITGTCPTDIDRNGDTGITDFLTLLGGWGACR